MYDTELDVALRASSPRVADVGDLDEHRARILKEARSRRARPLRLLGAAVVTSVVLVGGGSAVMAGAGNETPWGWVADNVFSIDRADGSACFQGILVKWEGVSEDDPMVVDAKSIVAGIDLETLDTSAAEAELRASNAAATDVDGNPSPITVSADQLKQEAVTQTVAAELWDAMAQRGYEMRPGHEVSLSSQTTDCR